MKPIMEPRATPKITKLKGSLDSASLGVLVFAAGAEVAEVAEVTEVAAVLEVETMTAVEAS